MAERVALVGERRSETGKGGARRTRRGDRIPAVIYGHGRTTQTLSVARADLDKVMHMLLGGSTIVDLTLDGETVQALIREVQRHPIRKNVTHVDFYEIHAGERIRLEVPVQLVGSPDGVRNAGGVLEQFLREIEIEVLPGDIPDRVEVDVTELKIAGSLHVRDVTVPNAKILTDQDATVCTVVPPRLEEEVVAAPAEEAVEPELIRRPKGEEEGEEGAEKGESAEE
jgi:large subunit ribosomal protein L25